MFFFGKQFSTHDPQPSAAESNECLAAVIQLLKESSPTGEAAETGVAPSLVLWTCRGCDGLDRCFFFSIDEKTGCRICIVSVSAPCAKCVPCHVQSV